MYAISVSGRMWLLVLLLFTAGASAEEMSPGAPLEIHLGKVESFDSMARRSKSSPQVQFQEKRAVLNPEEIPATVDGSVSASEKGFPDPSGQPVMKENFSFDAGGMSGGFPPDTNGAVGPSHILIMINFAVRIYDRSGNHIESTALDDFFHVSYNGVNYPKAGGFDPRVVYDYRTGRWIAVVLDFGDSYTVNGKTRRHRNYTLLCISHTSNPTGNWSKYVINSSLEPVETADGTVRYFTDYPTLGVDDNGIYLGYRVFPSQGSSFAMIIAANKQQFLDGDNVLTGGRWTSITDMYSAPYACVTMTSLPSDAAQFFLSSTPAENSATISYRKLKWNGTTPTLASAATTFAVDAVKDMINAPALGSSTSINTGDRRISSAPIRRGAEIMFTRSVGLNSSGESTSVSRTGQELHRVRVYTAAGAGPVADRQSLGSYDRDRVFDDASQNPYFLHHGSVSTNGRDHYVAAFAYTAANDYVNAAYTSAKKDAAVRLPIIYSEGENSYTQLDNASTPRNRWGDYTSTFADPANDSSIWSFQQRAGSTKNSFVIVASRFDMPFPIIGSINLPKAKLGDTVDFSILGEYFHSVNGRLAPVPATPVVALLLPAVQRTISGQVLDVPTEEEIKVRFTIPRDVPEGTRFDVVVTNPDGQEDVLEEALEVVSPSEETPTPAPTPTPTPTPTPEPPAPTPVPVTSGDICVNQQGLAGAFGAKVRGTRFAPEIESASCAIESQDSAVAFGFFLSETAAVEFTASVAEEGLAPTAAYPVTISLRGCCSQLSSEIACATANTTTTLNQSTLAPGFYTVLVETAGEHLIALQYSSSITLDPRTFNHCPTGPTPTPRPTPTPEVPLDPCSSSVGMSGSEGLRSTRMFLPIAGFESAPCTATGEGTYVGTFCFSVAQETVLAVLGTSYIINGDNTSDWIGDEEIQAVDLEEDYPVTFSLRRFCGGAKENIVCLEGLFQQGVLMEEKLQPGDYQLVAEAPYSSGFRVEWTSSTSLSSTCGPTESWQIK